MQFIQNQGGKLFFIMDKRLEEITISKHLYATKAVKFRGRLTSQAIQANPQRASCTKQRKC